MVNEEQTPIQRTDDSPGTAEAGSLDAAAEAFAKLAPPQAETEPADEGEATTEPEGEAKAEPEPEAAETPLVQVTLEGKTYDVPPEVQKAVLRQQDYSRSMNELGAQKKAVQQQAEIAEGLIRSADTYAQALADVRTIDTRIKAYEDIDFARLRADNPAEYAATLADQHSLRLDREAAVQKARDVHRQLQHERDADHQSKRAAMLEQLAKDLPGWGDELGQKITDYAVRHGYEWHDVAAVTDPRWVVMMDKARKFDAIEQGKASAREKAATAPPVARPGARVPAPNKAADALAKLRQTNTVDAAAAAFRARM